MPGKDGDSSRDLAASIRAAVLCTLLHLSTQAMLQLTSPAFSVARSHTPPCTPCLLPWGTSHAFLHNCSAALDIELTLPFTNTQDKASQHGCTARPATRGQTSVIWERLGRNKRSEKRRLVEELTLRLAGQQNSFNKEQHVGLGDLSGVVSGDSLQCGVAERDNWRRDDTKDITGRHNYRHYRHYRQTYTELRAVSKVLLEANAHVLQDMARRRYA
ncbi:hypothetical protein HaLaN_01310 [Haematococcus lacustris]|uniref:Uncharacterized protein n=1 Tax=Haematococcus lacustris TaxID=44745 RepID=A0A699YBF2_HAELA|nr:hypothetical protein HaLaN_01310 [Haematococcus lacustris]